MFVSKAALYFLRKRFKYVASSKSFVRKNDTGFSHHFFLRPLSNGSEITFYLEIRQKVILDLFEKICFRNGGDSLIRLDTLNNSFKEIDYLRFPIYDEEEQDIAIKHMIEFLDLADTFFQMYGESVYGLDKILNSEDQYPFFLSDPRTGRVLKRNKIHSTHDYKTVYLGIIIAKILDRKDIDFIVERNTSQLRGEFDRENMDEILHRILNTDYSRYQKIFLHKHE